MYVPYFPILMYVPYFPISDWEQVLSRRARQRVGFARVLLQRPAWIFMEEATDAFDPKGQRLILEMLRRELPDATLVTITFRSHPDLEALHDRTIVLDRGRKLDGKGDGH